MQWSADDHRAAVVSIEPLFRAGPDLVAGTFAHLASRPETAGLLGWEQHVGARRLEERRRFFTVWLARTLGVDTSDEFALYLWRDPPDSASCQSRHCSRPARRRCPIGSLNEAVTRGVPYIQRRDNPRRP